MDSLISSVTEDPKNRLKYRDGLVFILGGFSGAAINFTVTFFLALKLNLNPSVSFFFGVLANQFFHYLYYKVVYASQKVTLRTSLPLHFFLYFCVAFGSAVVFHFFIVSFNFTNLGAFGLSLSLLSLANVLLVRISTFSSAQLASVEYCEMNESYYDDQTNENKVSKFRAWYHRSRYKRLTRFIGEYYKSGMKIADLGSANCWWNTQGLPVVGVDINEKMLDWAKKNNRLIDYRVTPDLSKSGLNSKSFDLVVMSETLEHILDLPGVIAEVSRILKDDGTFLITVPYDLFLGPFFIFFNLSCLYMGYVKGSLYHRYRCGHINHFTKRRLRQVLGNNGFLVKRCFIVNGFLLYAEACKTDKAC
ncbi:MAG: class I SAM-dependent methyltransferase [Deltaproteobacteria bacterium]|nr:MAG: class I SAM-dependent methyltransferase [Deltaproteobacteria bacterium]